MNLKTNGLIVAGVAFGIYLISKKISNLASNVASNLNPANPGNYVNTAVTDMYQSVAGKNHTIGGDIYDGVQQVKKYYNGIFN